MKTLLLILMMSLPALAQSVEKRTGEIITLTVLTGEQSGTVNIYRKAGPFLASTKIASLPIVKGKFRYEFSYPMPAGAVATSPGYRFTAYPVNGTVFSDGSNEGSVKRK